MIDTSVLKQSETRLLTTRRRKRQSGLLSQNPTMTPFPKVRPCMNFVRVEFNGSFRLQLMKLAACRDRVELFTFGHYVMLMVKYKKL